jgi:hypothetical protein
LHGIEALSADREEFFCASDHELARWRELGADTDLCWWDPLEMVSEEIPTLPGIRPSDEREGLVWNQIAIVVVVVSHVEQEDVTTPFDELEGR